MSCVSPYIKTERDGVSMRCPRCGFDGESVGGGCARCGYGYMSMSSGPPSLAVQRSSSTSMPLTLQSLMRGDVLRQGRYRLIEQLSLPENQQGQGAAWLASDAQSSTRRVVIREVAMPEGSAADKERVVGMIASRMAEYGRQLCEILTILSQHQPPLVHGSINPSTIIVSSDAKRITLILMPLFPPNE